MTLIPTQTAMSALYQAVGDKLISLGANFSTRVYVGYHPFTGDLDSQVFPYVIIVNAGGGDANIRKHKDANINLQIVCYSDEPSESHAGLLAIDNALDDRGSQESSPSDRVDGGTWIITSVTAGRAISNPEFYKNAKTIYAEGKVYTFTMEIE